MLLRMAQGGQSQAPEHLLINYATEDWALAEWLTRKLTAEGYRVWCDRFKLLGGESYPKEIDDAIKNRTFRMLSLLSRASLTKPNPQTVILLAERVNLVCEKPCLGDKLIEARLRFPGLGAAGCDAQREAERGKRRSEHHRPLP